MTSGPAACRAGAGPAADLVRAAAAAGLTLATAESLTAGMLAADLATVPGASAVLQGGVIAYANSVKHTVLGVDGGLLAAEGSVDAEVAKQMAAGARRVLAADIGISTTGVAGPEPHDGKPVGCVFIAVAGPEQTLVREFLFAGDRAAVRRSTCEEALLMLGGMLTVRP